ncbi:PREDICTED: uncharacterized mitochondrial protein AtMg00810 [Theobroma cacao]|uniref:Uncharacterized mitochondrial protein AtMg00810 n=1 Tax=Theobroma cacao TaxID=3641 RepID=A0AB32WP37_THECC|nr:PREDICTED: uncharacterized mitochondrial protein AtMg00810 [Theobroma cacao]
MDIELKALEDNGTWSIVQLPSNCHAVGCKWVYKVKLNADGKVERYKARLVAKGYNQIEGFDYQKTFSPVVRQTTVRMFFALAATQNWRLSQLDINNAFLNGELTEEVYMELPQGYTIKGEYPTSSRLVCKLHKSLYGLKQASRAWNSKLTTSVLKYGFKQSNSDYSLFIMKTHRGDFIALLVYVDDILIASTSIQAENDVKGYLSSEFKLKDLRKVKYFLRLEIARSPEGISICQRKYALDLLEEHRLLGTKPASTPIDYNHKLVKSSDEDKLINATSYRQLIGKLLYLTFSIPDITYAVQVLSQFMDQPGLKHLAAAHRVLRYIKKAPGQGILMKSRNNLKISGYSDSDWIGCPNTRRSVTGYCIFVGDSLISWKSKKQSIVARSSAKAEYRSMVAAYCEIMWLKSLMTDFHIDHPEAVNLYTDSQ